MRLFTCTIIALAILAVASPDLSARASGGVQLISGTARIKRGRVRYARGAATHRALLTAVWRFVKPQLASTKGQRRLRRQLSRRVRKLIKRYRTKKVSRAGRQLTVLLAVTVDEPAVQDRLRALKVRLKKPGVLLVSHCEQGSVAQPLTAALKGRSIRVVAGSWTAQQQAAMVKQLETQPQVAATWAREAHSAVVVVVRCESAPLSKIVAAGVIGVRAKVVAQAYVPKGRTRVDKLLQLDQTGLGHDADVKKAAQQALRGALAKLAPRLGQALPPKLPSGLTRTLMVRLSGALDLATLLKLSRLMNVQLEGITAVRPRRFQRGSTWLAVETIYSPARLQQILTTVRPPPGWLLRVNKGPRPGTVDVKAELTEDS